jgi:hypothetical protein
MRLALGQILRYAQQLSYKEKPIMKVLAANASQVMQAG